MFVSSSNQLLQTFTQDFGVVFPKFWFSETPVAMNRNQCSMHSMYQQCISMLTYYQRWSCMVSFLIMPIFNNYPKTTPFPPTVSAKKTKALCPRVWRSSKHPKHLNPRSQNIPWLHLSWSYPQTSAHPKRNISTFSLKTMGNFFFETCWCDVRFFFNMKMMGKCWIQHGWLQPASQVYFHARFRLGKLVVFGPVLCHTSKPKMLLEFIVTIRWIFLIQINKARHGILFTKMLPEGDHRTFISSQLIKESPDLCQMGLGTKRGWRVNQQFEGKMKQKASKKMEW